MRIFDGCLGFEHFARNKETIIGTQGENKPVDPIFLLQFSNVQYMADNCAKFEKNHDGTSFSFKRSNVN